MSIYVCYTNSHKVTLYLSMCSLFNWLEIDARNYSCYMAASAEVDSLLPIPNHRNVR